MLFITELESAVKGGEVSPKTQELLLGFYNVFCAELKEHSLPTEAHEKIFRTYLSLVKQQIASPFQFESYHEQVRSPFDYYAFGLDFIRPLVDKENSTVLGQDHLKEILSIIEKGYNVVLFANHQIEADPLAISLLLEDLAPKLAEQMIFVAGERVLTDPLAVPFSMGRNLLCIYSKRYIDNPPEEKHTKQLHNKHTMDRMRELLKKGGKCIYVAPSGGRDRPNIHGEIEVAPFDQRSIEMFYLMARRAKTPTHFFPLALATYYILPPPKAIQIELGEKRMTQHGAIHLAVGQEIDMKDYPGSTLPSRQEQRKARAKYICNLVKADYHRF